MERPAGDMYSFHFGPQVEKHSCLQEEAELRLGGNMTCMELKEVFGLCPPS